MRRSSRMLSCSMLRMLQRVSQIRILMRTAPHDRADRSACSRAPLRRRRLPPPLAPAPPINTFPLHSPSVGAASPPSRLQREKTYRRSVSKKNFSSSCKLKSEKACSLIVFTSLSYWSFLTQMVLNPILFKCFASVSPFTAFVRMSAGLSDPGIFFNLKLPDSSSAWIQSSLT